MSFPGLISRLYELKLNFISLRAHKAQQVRVENEVEAEEKGSEDDHTQDETVNLKGRPILELCTLIFFNIYSYQD
ncbi:hypothetical protein ACFX13_036455 [Malus domestica]